MSINMFFISRKRCKTYKYTVKGANCILVPVCGEQQIKQGKYYKWLQVQIQTLTLGRLDTHICVYTL